MAAPGLRSTALSAARIARSWIPALLLLFAPLSARAESSTPTSPDASADLPPVVRFSCPVGDPADFTQPAPGEAHGYALTRGLSLRRERHLGLDLSNRQSGGEVRAPADGIVLEARRHGGWGQLVVIAHRLPGGDFVLSLLGHLKPGSIAVKPGDHVSAGQTIGQVGSSGHSTGPHLHLEFRNLGFADPWKTLWEQAPVLDPLRFLGHNLADALVPGWDGGPVPQEPQAPTGHWGESYLHRVLADASSTVEALGNPDAPLGRLEFYSWLARLSGSRLSAHPSWKTVRRALERRGLTELPGERAAVAAPLGREEAAHALSQLLSSDFLPGVRPSDRVTARTLREHRMRAPTPDLTPADAPLIGPQPALSRAEGALLVMAARSWPGAAVNRP
jgi:hypothetical protein